MKRAARTRGGGGGAVCGPSPPFPAGEVSPPRLALLDFRDARSRVSPGSGFLWIRVVASKISVCSRVNCGAHYPRRYK